MENAQYDAEGQLVTGSFMDYALPRAEDTRRRSAGKAIPSRRRPTRSG